jgi:hypothetical protein
MKTNCIFGWSFAFRCEVKCTRVIIALSSNVQSFVLPIFIWNCSNILWLGRGILARLLCYRLRTHCRNTNDFSCRVNRVWAEFYVPVDNQLLFLCCRLFPTGGTILNAVMTPWVRGTLFWTEDLHGGSVCMAELMSASLWEYRGWVQFHFVMQFCLVRRCPLHSCLSIMTHTSSDLGPGTA